MKTMFNFHYLHRWVTGTDVPEHTDADDGFDDGGDEEFTLADLAGDEESHQPNYYFPESELELDRSMIQASVDDGSIVAWRKRPGGEQWYKRRARTIHGVPE
jgi:hypothetical protein